MTEHQMGAAIRALFLAGGELYGTLSRRDALTDEAAESALARWRRAVEAHIHSDDPPPGMIPAEGPSPN